MIRYKSAREIELMREAGRLAADAVEYAGKLVEPGRTTGEIDAKVREFIIGRGAIPAFLGYRGFPANACVSINEEVVHGIPGPRKIVQGDLVSVDIGVKFKNYFGDCARTWGVGKISRAAARILDAGRVALQLATNAVTPGARLSNVSRAVQDYAESLGFGVVRKFVGHGIGVEMHEEPQVPNFVTPGSGEYDVVLKPGLVVALEPMLTEGTYDVETLGNGWTVVTKDRKLAVHFEDMVAVTDSGREVLTVM
ncbi:MAG: type I methionyl aminopeptidase [Planctomycetota bacterium]|nr:type I methionyl aminopeptidase [Planctomycetota bacterium]